MVVLITGTSNGIGKAAALLFLSKGHVVLGIDKEHSAIDHDCYFHYTYDIDVELPDIDKRNIDIVINNAGVQNTGSDIQTNLVSLIEVTEKYGIHPNIKSIVNVASTSAHNGAEFPVYCASKGGVLAYTKNVALRVAKYGATCNSISPGGVLTDMNKHIIETPELWKAVMDETLLPKWATAEEIAEWIYFVAVVNKSMTAQDIIIDNGELSKFNFIW